MSTNDMVVFFLSIAVMLSVGLLLGELMRKLHFPAIIGELFGGIILGPTVLGLISPAWDSWLFPQIGTIFDGRDTLSQICLLFFMFSAGLEMNLSLMRKRKSGILWTSLLGIAVPFALGYGIVVLFPGYWQTFAAGNTMIFALFLGTALSISALPVIARILMDMGAMNTELGMVIMGSATVNDLIGWTLFALLLSNFTSESVMSFPPYVTFILALLLFIGIVVIGRAVARQVLKMYQKETSSIPGVLFGVAMVYVLLAAAIAGFIGIHAVFGAFLVGMALSQGEGERNGTLDLIHQAVMYLFAPIYFVSIGLTVNFIGAFDPVLVGIVLVVACVGKIAGATIGALLGRLPARQAIGVGFAMNTRGAMEIILAGVAKSVGLIDDRVFVALIVMAIVTSVISGPVIARIGAIAKKKAEATT